MCIRDRVQAQQARRVLDRIVGYQGSQLLWKKVRRGLSMGRVQSVAVRLICDREKEREAFRAEEYWSIVALLAGDNPPAFEAKLHSVNGQDADIGTGERAQQILDAVQGKPFVVQSIERKEKKRNPVAPFITSRLQQEAARKLHFSPKKTMTLAQQLYEGIEIGAEGPTGLITYMRTDSPRISQEATEDARVVIRERFGVEYLPATPNVYKTQKAAQEAHEAIRPTSAARDPESIRQYLEQDQYNLYKLIWNRFIASQMVPAIMDVTRVDSSPVGTPDRYVFRTTGTVVKFAGHTAVYLEGTDKELSSRKPKNEQEAEDEALVAEQDLVVLARVPAPRERRGVDAPDGALVAAAGIDGRARVWSVQDGVLLGLLAGHEDRIPALEFTPDGQALVTVSWDSSARLWSVPVLRQDRASLTAEVLAAWRDPSQELNARVRLPTSP